MSKHVEAQNQEQFLAHLQYFAANQRLWEQLFPCDPASDIANEFAGLFERLCGEGRYDLALHAVYACRSDRMVNTALTQVFIALLADKIEREGMEATKKLFLEKMTDVVK